MEIFSSIRSRSIKLTSRTSTNQISSLARSNTADYGSLYWTFDPDNHYLSPRLTKLVYHKWTIRTWVITYVMIWSAVAAGVPEWLFWGCLVLQYMFFGMPFFTVLILSFNRDVSGFLIRSSEFWIKICYSVLNSILWIILYHKVGRKQDSGDVPEWLGYTSCALMMIVGSLFMAIVGGMDAIPKMKYKWKYSITAIVAVIHTYAALRFQLIAPMKDDYIVEVKATGSMVSFHSLLSNVNGMLAMFLWKQMIDVIRNKDRCISISYRPYLRWESDSVSSSRSRSIRLNSTAPTNQASSFARSNTADYGSLYWTFDPNNHYLSERLAELVHRKWTFRVWAISFVLNFFVAAGPPWFAQGYYVLKSVLFGIPYFTLVILSFNRDASGFLIRSSEFWIKIVYAVLSGILNIVLYAHAGRGVYIGASPLGYMDRICKMITLPLFMTVVGGMDAIPKMKYKWKSCFSAVVAVYFTFLAFYYQLVAPITDDHIIDVNATGSTISFHSLSSSVNGMLAMFLWKQMIDVVRNKDRCISINYKPYLRWEAVRNGSELMEPVIPENSTVVIEHSVN